MDELTLDNKKYLSSKRAAQVTGYAKDYVGQLCREGRVEARLVGRNWYILESSILEHRFGSEETTPSPEPTPEELETAWQTPKYTSEPIQTVPTLAPKPLIPPPVAPQPAENQQVLADMQSAWKEWFDREEKTLPDASAMLLDDHEAATESETEVSSDVEASSGGDFFPVHIERHPEVEEEPEPMRIQPIRAPRPVEEVIQPTYKAESAEKPRMRPVRTTFRTERPRKAGKSGIVLRAAFISLAGLAILATLIGSGAFDSVLAASGSSFFTDFISGTQKINK